MGGVGGMLAGIMLILAYGLLTLGYPPQTCCSEEFFRQALRSPALLVLFNMPIPSAWALSIPLFLALYTSLRKTSVRYALLGTVSGVIAVSIASINLFASIPLKLALAELYSKTADADKKTMIGVAEAISSSSAASLPLFFLFLIIAFLAVGAAMGRSAAFRNGYGWLSIVLGIILVVFLPLGGLLMFLQLWVPQFFALVIIPPILWLILVGFKIYRLSNLQVGSAGFEPAITSAQGS